jgi:hypothetical protein
MLLHNRPVSILKQLSVTFVISAMLFFTGTGISPLLTAAETKGAAEETAKTDAGGALSSEQLDELVGPPSSCPPPPIHCKSYRRHATWKNTRKIRRLSRTRNGIAVFWAYSITRK